MNKYMRIMRDGRNPYGSRGGYVSPRRPMMRRGDRGDYGYDQEYARNGRGDRENDYGMRGGDYGHDMRGGDYGYDMRGDMRGDMRYDDYDRHYEFEYNQYDGMGMELTRKEMKKWEKAMENSDGSRGFKFKEEQILPITQQHGIKFGKDFSEEEFVLAVNMLYSDYCKVLGGDLQLYIKMAKAFLCDDDFDGTGSEKLALYYRYIVDNEG